MMAEIVMTFVLVGGERAPSGSGRGDTQPAPHACLLHASPLLQPSSRGDNQTPPALTPARCPWFWRRSSTRRAWSRRRRRWPLVGGGRGWGRGRTAHGSWTACPLAHPVGARAPLAGHWCLLLSPSSSSQSAPSHCSAHFQALPSSAPTLSCCPWMVGGWVGGCGWWGGCSTSSYRRLSGTSSVQRCGRCLSLALPTRTAPFLLQPLHRSAQPRAPTPPRAGCSINPARSLGPAIVSGTWPGTFWVFIVGPFVGALFACPLHMFFRSDWVS